MKLESRRRSEETEEFEPVEMPRSQRPFRRQAENTARREN